MDFTRRKIPCNLLNFLFLIWHGTEKNTKKEAFQFLIFFCCEFFLKFCYKVLKIMKHQHYYGTKSLEIKYFYP